MPSHGSRGSHKTTQEEKSQKQKLNLGVINKAWTCTSSTFIWTNLCVITFSTHLFIVSVSISPHHNPAHVGDLHLRHFVLSLLPSTSNLLLLLLRPLAVPLCLLLGNAFLRCITGVIGRTVVCRTHIRCLRCVCLFVEIGRFLVV